MNGKFGKIFTAIILVFAFLLLTGIFVKMPTDPPAKPDLDGVTYYFYDSDGWNTVYAYTWTEKAVAVTPQTGDYVLMGNLLDNETQWTAEGSVKLQRSQNDFGVVEYSFQGLQLTAGMQFKIVQLGETEHTYYNALESGVDGSLYSYGDDGNIVIAKDGIYDFYFKEGSKQLYFTTGTTLSEPNIEVVTTELLPWPGEIMSAVPNHNGWFSVVIDNKAEKIIFTNGILSDGKEQTETLFLNPDTPYYCSGWHSDMQL